MRKKTFESRFRWLRVIFLLMILWLPMTGLCQNIPVWPHESSDLSPDPAVKFGKLANGFRYVLMYNAKPKNRISMHLDVQVGSFHETDEQLGIAHFLEHMLFQGSEHFKPGELVTYFQKIGMQFGPDANGHTGFFETVYDILLPGNGKETIEDAFVVLKDYAAGALLLPEEIDRERKVVLAEKRSRDSVDYRTHVATLKFELANSRVPNRFPIGKETILKRADRRVLKDFYDTWYRPENMILVIVGDFDIESTIALIKSHFSQLSDRADPRPEPDMGKIVHKGIKPFYHFEKEASSTDIDIEVIRQVPVMTDSLALRKKRILENLANRIIQNRLNKLLREPDSPLTAASIYSGIFLKQIQYAGLNAECTPENWHKCLTLMERTLRQVLEFGFDPTELDRVKADYLSMLDKAVRTAATRDSTALANSLIYALNNNQVFLSPEQEKALFAPIIESADTEEVLTVFRELWASDHRLILVTGNVDLPDGPMSPEQQILHVYQESLAEKVSSPQMVDKKKFPYLPEPKPVTDIAKRRVLSDPEMILLDLNNGVRINIMKTDFDAGQVHAILRFGKGRFCEPPDKPGLSALAEDVINESGLGQMNEEELKYALTGKNTNVWFSIEEDHFAFKGTSISDETPLLFQLLYAHLMDPAVRDDAFKLSMERFRQYYLRLQQSVDGAMILHVGQFLAGGDSRFGLPAWQQFETLTVDDVRSWLMPFTNKGDLEISIVGDLDVNQVERLAQTYFGNFRQMPKAPERPDPRSPVFPTGRHEVYQVKTRIPKALAIVALPTDDIWNISRTRRLVTLAQVVSDRMRVTIRDKMGEAYSPYAYNDPSLAYPGYGVFKAVITVDPKKADPVIRKVKAIIADVYENGVTEDELKRAVEPLITRIKDSRRKNRYWLHTVLSGCKWHPERLEWSRTILEDYTKITTEDLSKIAKSYFDSDKITTIIIKPEQEEISDK